MIDEKKLIDCFRKLRGIDSLANMFINNVIKEIEKQPKIGEWIPCSQRLPEIPNGQRFSQEVLVAFKNYNGQILTDISHYSNDDNCWLCDSSVCNIKTMAWMPLPEPYKEE